MPTPSKKQLCYYSHTSLLHWNSTMWVKLMVTDSQSTHVQYFFTDTAKTTPRTTVVWSGWKPWSRREFFERLLVLWGENEEKD